jgi:hypothetical protein
LVTIKIPENWHGCQLFSSQTECTHFKYTALACAVQAHDLEAARILLSRGANVHKSGAKLLKLARDGDPADSFGLVALLKKYGATE